jgi:hypothetical protein
MGRREKIAEKMSFFFLVFPQQGTVLSFYPSPFYPKRFYPERGFDIGDVDSTSTMWIRHKKHDPLGSQISRF